MVKTPWGMFEAIKEMATTPQAQEQETVPFTPYQFVTAVTKDKPILTNVEPDLQPKEEYAEAEPVITSQTSIKRDIIPDIVPDLLTNPWGTGIDLVTDFWGLVGTKAGVVSKEEGLDTALNLMEQVGGVGAERTDLETGEKTDVDLSEYINAYLTNAMQKDKEVEKIYTETKSIEKVFVESVQTVVPVPQLPNIDGEGISKWLIYGAVAIGGIYLLGKLISRRK